MSLTLFLFTFIIVIFISIRYVASPENLIQLIILGITTALVLRPDQTEDQRGDEEEGWQERRHLAALVLTLSCMMMMMMNFMIF